MNVRKGWKMRIHLAYSYAKVEEALMHLMCGFVVLFYFHLFLVGWEFRETSENVCKARH